MDELRDYRFYDTDMIHPAESGINYIWKRFVETYIEKNSLPLMNRVDALMKAFHHRPNNPDDPACKEFLRKTLSEMEEISEKYPFIDFKTEKEILAKRLDNLK